MTTLLYWARLALVCVLSIALASCAPGPGPEISSASVGHELTPQQLAIVVTSNQIVFQPKPKGGVAAICQCGPKVGLNEISRWAREAIVAIEDRHFYDHTGFDVNGVVRALVRTATSLGRHRQGGSTLTEQLIKNTFLDSSPSLSRKLREASLAQALETAMTKDQILAAYLNAVIYGYVEGVPVVGIEQAARHYFGRTAAELDLRESAELAAMVQAPVALGAPQNEERLEQRTRLVLENMKSQGFITPAQLAKALAAQRKRGGLRMMDFQPQSFLRWVVADIHARDPQFVPTKTTRIAVTLQVASQSRAEAAAIAKITAFDRAPQFGFLSLAYDGRVLTYIGQRDFRSWQLDFVSQTKRPAASSFKPFVYLTALEHGARLNKEMATALAKSDNGYALNLMDQVGPNAVADNASLLGVHSNLVRVKSLAIGTSDVSLMEMVAAYGAFATEGIAVVPHGYYGVVQDGEISLWYGEPRNKRVISKPIAQEMQSLLRGVVLHGTGHAAKNIPGAAGKTGTSKYDRDAWFVGFTPQNISGTWVGRPDNAPMGEDDEGAKAASLWAGVEGAYRQ